MHSDADTELVLNVSQPTSGEKYVTRNLTEASVLMALGFEIEVMFESTNEIVYGTDFVKPDTICKTILQSFHDGNLQIDPLELMKQTNKVAQTSKLAIYSQKMG